MKTTEQIKLEVKELENQIKLKIDKFIEVNGECSVNISSYANFIPIEGGRKVFAGHEVEVTITI
jgi:hypothetical protein